MRTIYNPLQEKFKTWPEDASNDGDNKTVELLKQESVNLDTAYQSPIAQLLEKWGSPAISSFDERAESSERVGVLYVTFEDGTRLFIPEPLTYIEALWEDDALDELPVVWDQTEAFKDARYAAEGLR